MIMRQNTRSISQESNHRQGHPASHNMNKDGGGQAGSRLHLNDKSGGRKQESKKTN